jgi:hypothetical protein
MLDSEYSLDNTYLYGTLFSAHRAFPPVIAWLKELRMSDQGQSDIFATLRCGSKEEQGVLALAHAST